MFKTKAGYHIIQMVSRDGDDAVIRHILRTPKITDVEVNEAINKLDSASQPSLMKMVSGLCVLFI